MDPNFLQKQLQARAQALAPLTKGFVPEAKAVSSQAYPIPPDPGALFPMDAPVPPLVPHSSSPNPLNGTPSTYIIPNSDPRVNAEIDRLSKIKQTDPGPIPPAQDFFDQLSRTKLNPFDWIQVSPNNISNAKAWDDYFKAHPEARAKYQLYVPDKNNYWGGAQGTTYYYQRALDRLHELTNPGSTGGAEPSSDQNQRSFDFQAAMSRQPQPNQVAAIPNQVSQQPNLFGFTMSPELAQQRREDLLNFFKQAFTKK